MFIELVDILRCPNPHEETWLVLAASRVADRDIMEGTLGCPVCAAEFPIVGGTARFGAGRRYQTPPAPANDQEALRLAALLDLTGSRGYAILTGEAVVHAPLLREMTDVHLLLVDPPEEIAMGRGLSALTIPSSHTLPLAAESARAIALETPVLPGLLASSARTLTTGGRLLAPADLDLPADFAELARDERQWLAERTRAPMRSGIVTIEHRR